MYSWSNSDDRVAIVQMNAELRNAQLEMLSAQCATDRIRLRFSAEDIARYAQQDILRKAVSSATALYDYYHYLAKQVSDPELLSRASSLALREEKVREAIRRLMQYLADQRERYRAEGVPLREELRGAVEHFFPSPLLQEVRMVEVAANSITNPPFYEDAKALGLTNLPELVQMTSLTFDDVLVFQGSITERSLFHALVHAVQFKVLGLERYTELFVRGFLRTRFHVTVPLEAHAFLLESEFVAEPRHVFAVEARVRLWMTQGRY